MVKSDLHPLQAGAAASPLVQVRCVPLVSEGLNVSLHRPGVGPYWEPVLVLLSAVVLAVVVAEVWQVSVFSPLEVL